MTEFVQVEEIHSGQSRVSGNTQSPRLGAGSGDLLDPSTRRHKGWQCQSCSYYTVSSVKVRAEVPLWVPVNEPLSLGGWNQASDTATVIQHPYGENQAWLERIARGAYRS